MFADQRHSRLLVGICVLIMLSLAAYGKATMQPQVLDKTPLTSLLRPAAGPLPATDSQAAVPVRIRIPEIGVDAPVGPLQVDKRGVLLPPETNNATGWWENGPKPGERGPAVVAGHFDSYRGPAVFFRLPDLRAGSRVLIDRADHTTAVFTTYRIERDPKSTFPTQAVYGPTPDSELRLITCGGDFDETNKRYLANIIVFARRTS